jgi:hypothetical protein
MKRLIVIAALLMLTLVVVAHSLVDFSTGPVGSYKACEDALRGKFKEAMEDPDAKPYTVRPAECEGVSDEQLQQIIATIMRGD